MSPRIQIDRAKVRAALRKLGNESIFCMLIDAIELLPQAKLDKLAKKHINPELLLSDVERAEKPALLAEVKAFEKASLAGKYYKSFNVNSKNYTEKSPGTRAWIAEFDRLLKRCVISAKEGNSAEVRHAMDILFGLLDHIDKCLNDVIFFADEGGSWQVGVDWAKVLPVWFTVLSATAEPEEYARRIITLLSSHYSHGSPKMLVAARRTATPAQRKALAQVKGA